MEAYIEGVREQRAEENVWTDDREQERNRETGRKRRKKLYKEYYNLYRSPNIIRAIKLKLGKSKHRQSQLCYAATLTLTYPGDTRSTCFIIHMYSSIYFGLRFIHLYVKLKSQLDITIQSLHCTRPDFFEYFVLPDDGFVEEAEICSIK
jgi:hypothetical protein